MSLEISNILKDYPLKSNRDYWIISLLERLASHKLSRQLVLKGGCALKYFYRLSNRYVYDIDLVATNDCSAEAIRLMYNDIALGCHYSTDITSMFQHIKWRPFDFQEIDEAIRIDYVMGEHVLAYNKMSFTADYFCENIGLTKTFDFELNIMDINNIFMEKMLACSDKFNQQRFDKAEKHFFDLLNIFTNCVINPNTIMDFLEKKKGLDLKIIDNSRIYETFKFVVFKTDNEFLNKLLLQANELKCLQMLDFIRDIT